MLNNWPSRYCWKRPEQRNLRNIQVDKLGTEPVESAILILSSRSQPTHMQWRESQRNLPTPMQWRENQTSRGCPMVAPAHLNQPPNTRNTRLLQTQVSSTQPPLPRYLPSTATRTVQWGYHNILEVCQSPLTPTVAHLVIVTVIQTAMPQQMRKVNVVT